MVAAMTGGTSAKAALRNAIEGFTVISFADLSPSDLRTNTAGSGHEKAAAAHEAARAAGGMPIVTKSPLEAAAARTRHVPLGGCDAFVSHSWSDDADHKFEQLSACTLHSKRDKQRTPRRLPALLFPCPSLPLLSMSFRSFPHAQGPILSNRSTTARPSSG